MFWKDLGFARDRQVVSFCSDNKELCAAMFEWVNQNECPGGGFGFDNLTREGRSVCWFHVHDAGEWHEDHGDAYDKFKAEDGNTATVSEEAPIKAEEEEKRD